METTKLSAKGRWEKMPADGGSQRMTPEKIKELKLFANKGRMYIVKETHEAKSGHPGGNLSSMDYMTYLHNEAMRIDPQNTKD